MSTPALKTIRGRQRVAAVVVTLASLGGAVTLLSARYHRAAAPVYSAEGFGGYVAAPQPLPQRTSKPAAGNRPASGLPGVVPVATVATAVTPRAVQDAYSAGRYRDAEALATQVIASAAAVAQPKANDAAAPRSSRRDAARARQIQAFAAARRHDLPLARARFALLKKEAAALPDGGRPQTPTPVGEAPGPTLEESAAYQHAVCTGALGDKAGAEAEYVAFLKAYPDSPLLHAAVKRIARLHGGDVPHVAEAAWKRAMAVQQGHEQARQREASLCAPECLAELLRRRGDTTAADVAQLAREMQTSDQGTSLRALADVAERHGLRARGLRLSHQGLLGQKLPAIALIVPGHFVLVERAHPLRVWVWDPDANGPGKPGTRQFSRREWANVWGGVALTLEAAGGNGDRRQTASR